MKSVTFFLMIVGIAIANCQYGTKSDGYRHYSDHHSHSPPTVNIDHDKWKPEHHSHHEWSHHDEPKERDPNKIPTLMNPSECIGLLSAKDQSISDRCFRKPECDYSARYRTMDGSCNNLKFPVWGQSQTANIRIIQADYSDGISKPRKAKSGKDLPNVRRIRTTIFNNVDKPSHKNNLFLMQFGQAIAHDTQLSKAKTLPNGDKLDCCNSDNSTPKVLPKDCLQIRAPLDDPVPNKQCLSGERRSDTADIGCSIKPVRQRLQVTSFIDASLLYGSDPDTARSLRSFVDGKLRDQTGPNEKSYLPNVEDPSEVCNEADENTVCYVSGDVRVNQHPQMAVQTISFLRLHNYLCDELKNLNYEWNDERLYQEARRLLIAMYQHVTYNEFVPIILGKDYARVNRLLPLNEGYNSDYDENLNPTTITSFTAAAFRALHSLIQGFLSLFNEARKVTDKLRLSDFFQRTEIVQQKDNYDNFYRGLLTQKMQGADEHVTREISDYLFRRMNKTDGFDLISFDLERGRDYGEPSYNKFRQLCGLSKAKTFNDLSDQISKKHIDALSSIYENVDDIDFYAGGMLEKLKPGSMLGHTFQCINGEMFYRWKYGDRFFYEFGYQPGSFTSDQLREIRKTTLALIVCLTSDIQSVQRYAFDVPSQHNPLVSCQSITKLNLNYWRENY